MGWRDAWHSTLPLVVRLLELGQETNVPPYSPAPRLAKVLRRRHEGTTEFVRQGVVTEASFPRGNKPSSRLWRMMGCVTVCDVTSNSTPVGGGAADTTPAIGRVVARLDILDIKEQDCPRPEQVGVQ